MRTSSGPASWIPAARAAAAVLGLGLLVAQGRDAPTVVAAVLVVALAVLTAVPGVTSALDRNATARSIRAVAEVGLGLAVASVTDGVASPFVPFLAASVLAAGLAIGRPGGGAAGVLSGLLLVQAGPGWDVAVEEPALPVTLVLLLALIGVAAGGEGDGRDPGTVTDTLVQRRRRDVLLELTREADVDPTVFDETVVLDELAVGVAHGRGRGLAFGRVGAHAVTVASWDGARGTIDVPEDQGEAAWLPTVQARWPAAVSVVLARSGDVGLALDRVATSKDHLDVGRAELAMTNARLHRRLRELGADQERRRLAADLHDGLSQSLAQLRFELDLLTEQAPGLEPGEVAARLTRLVKGAERSLGDARATVIGLRASVAQDGLVETLRSYVRDVAALAGPGVRFQAETDATVAEDVAQQLLLVVQEAMANALRHAGASQVSVVVSDGPDDGVDIVLRDDGTGFDPGAHEDGDGMVTMSSRAARAGAALLVRSTVGGGTTVTIRLPSTIIEHRETLATPGPLEEQQ